MSQRSFDIKVPHQCLAGGGFDMSSRLQTWDWRMPRPNVYDKIVLDFSTTTFIEPWSLSQYTAHTLRLGNEFSLPIECRLDSRNPANVYLEEMGILKVLETFESTSDWDDSRQNTGIHIIREHDDVTRFVRSVAQLGPGPNDDTVDALKYSMAEMSRNVVQHSGSPVGGVAIAQYFPDRDAIQISISDCGIGIPEALKATYPEIRGHLEGLKLAILPHVSGAFKAGMYSASDNAGLGLFFTKEICWRAGGSFWLVSNSALLSVKDNDAAGDDRTYVAINDWEGTSVTMDLPASGISDFGGLLGVCRELAEKARNASGVAGLDFLYEIPDLKGLKIVNVGDFNEDVEQAAKTRNKILLPAITGGGMVILNFEGARFATQSFIHALLNDVLRIPGSLCRLSFVNCTKPTEEAIRAVAAYAASYKLCV